MSQEVDERVVKLSFDNEKFEKNVKQSIHSLRALNDSLRLDGAEKGFEEVEKASEQVDFDKVQGAVETLSSKFSALEVVGVTALVRITNKAIDAGERLAKSLSIDQVTAGWSKYAEKTASVQTIMNATGKSITKVNRYLDKLMWYSDETSYGFNDMTASLGQLTAAGGDIDKLVPMIMGIANATAYAGKGASEFKRVIYNLNQSYSQGYLNLMDWKSVELAGVATAELKKQLIQTGVELGKIKEGDVNIGTFNTSLAKKWADKQVMETAFGRLAEFSEAVKNRVDEMDDPYYQTADAIEELAGQYDEVTVKAFKAAQEAKSFSEVVDATKDAVSTGWMKTFDILFGNYDEAKKFWTDLAGEFWTIFAGGADGRNSWLKAGLDSGLDQLLDQTALGDVGDSFTELLQKSLLDSGKITAEGIEEAGSFQKAIEEAGITAQDLYDQVQLSLAVYKEAANLSDQELKGYNVSRSTLEKTIAAYEKMAEAIQNGEVNLEDYADQMSRMSGREHFYAGILNILEGINSVLVPIRAAFNEVFMTDGSPLYNLLKGFDELTAKFALSDETGKKVQKVFKGVFSVLSVGFKTIRTAGRIVLAVLEALLGKLEPLGDLLLSVGAAFGDVFTKLNDSLNSAESFEDVITAIATAFGTLIQPLKDVFGALKALVTGSSIEDAGSRFSAFGKIVDAVNGIFQNFGLGTISLSGLIGKALRVLGGIFYVAFDGVRTLIANAFAGFQDAGKAVNDFKDKNLDTLTEVRDTVVSLPEKAGEAMKGFAGNVQSAFYTVADACKVGLSAILKFFHLEDGLDFYRTLSLLVVGAVALAIWAVASALKALNKQIENTKKAVTNALKNPVTELLNSMKKAVDAWAAQHTTNNFVNVAKGISIAIGAISASIYVLSKIENPMQAAQAVAEVIAVLFGLVIAMKALAKEDITGLDSAKIFATMISFSAGMLAFSASIKGIVQAMKMLKYFSKDQMNNAVGGLLAIGLVIGPMVGLIGGLNYFNNKLMAGAKIKMANVWKGTSAYLVVATALVEVAGALYLLGNLDESKFQDAYGAMFTMSIVMELMVGLIGGLNYFNNKLQAASKNKLRGITEGSSAFLVMAGALVVVAGAAKLFSTVGNLDDTMWAMLGTLTVMAAAITVMSKFGGKARKMRSGAASMLIIGGALYIVAQALKTMHDAMLYDEDGSGWAGLAVNLILLGTAVAILGKHAPESMAAAAAIAALGAAMILMAEAIKMLTEVQPFDIGKGVIALGLSLMVLVGGAAWLPGASKNIMGVAGACLMLSTALLLLTPAFKGLASLSAGQAFAGVLGMAGLMGALWLIGSNPAVSAGLVVFSACLISLAKAFSVFAGGLLKLAGAAAILSVLMLFAEPISKAIIEAEPSIEEALIALIKGLCNVIIQCALPVGLALEAVILTLITVILDTLQVLFTGKSSLLPTITDGLDSTWDGILNWFAEHSIPKLIKDWLTGFLPKDSEGNLNWTDILLGEKGTPTRELLDGTFSNYLNPTGTLLKGFFKAVANFDDVSKKQLAEAKKNAEDLKKNEKDAADATGVAAKNAKDTAVATQLSAKSTEDYADGMIDIVDSTGKIHKATAEQVKALQDGEITMDDLLSATDDTAGAMNGLSDATDTANGKLQNGAVMAQACKAEVDGAANVISETGDSVEAQSGELKDTVDTAVSEAGDSAKEIAGQKGDEAGDSLVTRFCNRVNGLFSKLGINVDTNKVTTNLSNGLNGLITPDDMLKQPSTNKAGTDNPLLTDKGKKTVTEQLYDTFLSPIADTVNEVTDAINPTGTGNTKGTGSTKQKTAAEIIADKYKAALEKNKQLREQADTGYELWLAENENTASAEELAAKRAENIQNDIDRQSERVNLALQQYNELAKLGEEAESEARDAWNDYLSEKKDLETLKATQYTDLYKEANDAADKNLELLEAQYDLASTKGERTDTKEQKRKREEEYLKSQRKDLETKEKNAQAQYDYLTKTLGLAETDQRVQDALKELVDAQKEAADLENQIAEKQLEEIEIRLEDWENDHKKVTARMDRLTQVYGDGDLSARKDDYKNAVDTYGKNSAEAQKAKYEGTTSAILAAVTAFQNLNYQMGYTKNLEEQLANAKAEDKADIEAQIRDSESAFLGFAENLADAFNMDAYGKRAVLKVANSFQKNRKALKEKWDNVWAGLTEKNPQLADAGIKMGEIIGEAFGETWAEVGTESVSTIVSLMQGDWANALASGVSLMLEFALNKEVQEATARLINDIGGGLNELGLNFTNLAKVAKNSMGEQGVTGEVAASTGLIAQVASDGSMLSGLTGIVENLGAAIAAFLGEYGWVILAVLAVVGAIAGIAALVNKKGQDTGKDLDQSVADGVTDNKDKVTDSIRDMTDDATDTMADTISTIRRLTGDEYEYTPCITPVVDLTNVEASAADVQSAFAGYDLSGTASQALAAKVDAQAEIQNGMKNQSNEQLLTAVLALGDRMDGVGESIRGMKLTVDGKRTIGYIDNELGARAARRMR